MSDLARVSGSRARFFPPCNEFNSLAGGSKYLATAPPDHQAGQVVDFRVTPVFGDDDRDAVRTGTA